MTKNDFKKIIADYLADMEILDRKDLNQSIKDTLIKNNITETKEASRNPKKIARKKMRSERDFWSISFNYHKYFFDVRFSKSL